LAAGQSVLGAEGVAVESQGMHLRSLVEECTVLNCDHKDHLDVAWKNSTTTVRSDVSNFSTTFVSASAAEKHRVLLISMQTNEKSSISTFVLFFH